MLITSSPMNIIDYCNDFKNGKIKVDTNYQRTDKVWPEQAKKYLIETILLGYPIPKFFLHQKIDAKSKTALKFIVDGQQRTKAIVEFFKNDFRISSTCRKEAIAGKSFDTLPEEYQNNFLSYSLPIDLFVTALKEEIIETFRRINSYTVPLNAEEKRHSYHQGKMKWFIHGLATKYSDKLSSLGVFTGKKLARMADCKFYAELVFFMDRADVVTTSAKNLDALYSKYEKEFIREEEFEIKLDNGLLTVLGWDWLKGMSVTTPHIFEMLVLALINSNGRSWLPKERIQENISALSEALEEGQSEEYKHFLNAASKTTNDGTRRKTIVDTFYSAIYS